MGVCLSCLGRRESDVENPETSRLLYDEPYRSHYGSNQNPQRSLYQADPESLRREREALEAICHSMSDDVVDVFTILSPSTAEGKLFQRKQVVDSSSLTCVGTVNPATLPQPRTNGFKQPEIKSEAEAYKTIRRGRVGRIAAPLKKDEREWQATKAVMG